MTRWLTLVALLVVLPSCSSRPKRPAGPPPEYERPRVIPWDAGTPRDPLDDVAGEAVTDDDDADASPAATDASVAPGGDASDAALSLDGGVG